MENGKIAIITDSSCDIPKEYIEENHVFVLPLQVNMPDGEYLDGINITPEEVYSRMPEVIPTTSQPSPGQVMELLDKIKDEGYQEAIAICMSSGLSGTYNTIRMCADQVEGLQIQIVDTHRLSMALGFVVMQAVEMNRKGCSQQEIVDSLNDNWKKTNGFFCIPSLTYLIKGGRIGLVAGTVGNILGIIPIISIDNKEGRYFTYAKVRSYSLAIKKIEEIIKTIIKDKVADIAVLQGGALEKAKEVFDSFKNIEGLRNIYISHISPALGVHTGPGMFGIAYRIVSE
jgi:DegV family protein with EDD domain